MTSLKWTQQRVAASAKGMIATQHFKATEAGTSVLEEGGNAVDAAVAAAFALCVCEPQACGLGGQTMMTLHLTNPSRNIALDGSSRAPNRATAENIPQKKLRFRGYKATTVPSTPATLAYAAKKYGRLPLSRLLEPAIEIASKGYEITELQRKLQIREGKKWHDGNAGALFLKDGKPYDLGDLFIQPILASTLQQISQKGVEEFYQGDIAHRIHEDISHNGGFMQLDDLANIPWPIERRPLSCRFEDLRIFTFPPPGAGRTLIQMFNVASHFKEWKKNIDTPSGAVLIAEIIRRAQLDRKDRPFDPNFYPQVDDKKMVGVDYAKLVAKQIRARLKMKLDQTLGPTDGMGGLLPEEVSGKGETTHLSVMDAEGNCVGLTQSIERVYGSFAATSDLGFIYNNYMSAFEYDDFTHPYYMRPNAVPWASVAPTVIFKGRRPWLVIGSPGSERITSTIFQIILRLRYQSPLDAVVAPRIHCSAAGKVSFEAPWMRNDIPLKFEERGFKIDPREAFSFYMGCAQLVIRERQMFVGVADPRRDGTAMGPLN